MRTFGIDIWSPMDKVMKNNQTVADVLSNALPLLLITSRNESSSYTKRYFLKPNELMNCNGFDCDVKHTEGSIGRFLTNFFEGKATHDIKSQVEPVQRENDSGVITLTGNSFHVLLMNNLTRNALIHFYTPWCGRLLHSLLMY